MASELEAFPLSLAGRTRIKSPKAARVVLRYQFYGELIPQFMFLITPLNSLSVASALFVSQFVRVLVTAATASLPLIERFD
jgi:hypothetical protein